MANDFLTIADCIADALDLSDIEVTDLSNAAPFVTALPVNYSSNGEVHKYTKETAAPVVGFRAEYAGRDFSHSGDTLVTITLKILDFSFAVDVAVADRWKKGGPTALIAREGLRHLRAALFAFEKQVLNGTVGGAGGGFVGLANVLLLADTAHVVNATGSTANTGSSVYLVRMGEEAVSGVLIEDSPVEFKETIIQNFVDGDGKNYPAYYTPASAWCGLQIGGAHDVVRICNLTAQAGKGLTDDLIYDALELFPGERKPTHIVMGRRSLKQLRKSRTATNATGTPAPLPTEVEGIPIIKTEAMTATEAILA